MREVVPDLHWVAIIANVNSPIGALKMREVQTVVGAVGLEVVPMEIRQAEDIAPTFKSIKSVADALYVMTDPLINTNRVQINTFALAARLPTMHADKVYVEAGGLMSYGPNFPDLFRSAGDYCGWAAG